MDLTSRVRRNRQSRGIRGLVCETVLRAEDLCYPLFFHEGKEDEPIDSMPSCVRWSLEGLVREAREAHALGILAVVLFPVIPEKEKSPGAEECLNADGLVPRAVRALKKSIPDLVVVTDVALDPYNSEGHDGLVKESSGGKGEIEVMNDETVALLAKQARCHAEAGADMVAPSDMMDGRVGAIRRELDRSGFQRVGILSYTAKYASAYYGPFRDALKSSPKTGDKRSYQMDPRNVREALRELKLDEEEGADMVMVKPAGPYLDVVAAVRQATTLPVAAYQVSGEYLMIQAAGDAGWLDREEVIWESVLGIKRAGADIIVTYFAKELAKKMSEK